MAETRAGLRVVEITPEDTIKIVEHTKKAIIAGAVASGVVLINPVAAIAIAIELNRQVYLVTKHLK